MSTLPRRPVEPSAPVWELSGWWRRVGAYGDRLISSVSIPITVLIAIVGIGADPPPTTRATPRTLIWSACFAYLVATLGLFHVDDDRLERPDRRQAGHRHPSCARRRPAGRRHVRLRSSDARDGASSSAGRASSALMPTILNYLWPLWDDKNQALHDKIVKSRVVRARR